MWIAETMANFTEAVEFATRCITDDPDPRNEREAADGEQYLVRILAAVTETALLVMDPTSPAFLPMMDSVRYLGAAGPDIDYDVAAVLPGVLHRVTGTRGDATFVGICVYSGAGAEGATAIVDSVDVDDIVDENGTFTYEFAHPDQARVIVRQYFHDRDTQASGAWTIGNVDAGSPRGRAPRLPTTAELDGRIANVAKSIRWNAGLNRLWTPERRAFPNEFISLTADDIVAAVPNPDVNYAFAWWRMDDPTSQVIEVRFTPPQTPYWSLRMCDRWFQCFPDGRSNLNDQQCELNDDGSVTIVLGDGDPGAPNWIDTRGHHIGTMFFRWLHVDIDLQPTCRVVERSAFMQ